MNERCTKNKIQSGLIKFKSHNTDKYARNPETAVWKDFGSYMDNRVKKKKDMVCVAGMEIKPSSRSTGL